jgi:hypothetical protein
MAKKASAGNTPRKKTVKTKAGRIRKSGPTKSLPDHLDSTDDLRSRVDSLVEAWKAAAQKPSGANVSSLARRSAELEAAARRVREHAEAFAESARITTTSLERIKAGAAKVSPVAGEGGEVRVPGKERLFEEPPEVRAEAFEVEFAGPSPPPPPPPAEGDMPLASFFQQVSGAVIKAQQRLDLASLSYAQELKDSPIPPSLFSIPKVTAEIKLGLSAQKGSNVLVTLFGKAESTTNFSESTVSFDVVASPPPPGGAGSYSAPVPSFIVVGPERDRAAAALAGIRDLIRARTGVDLAGDVSIWLPTAVLLRAGAEAVPAAGRAEYLLVKRGDTSDKPVFTVRFNLADPRGAKIVNIADADLKLALFDLVARIREWETSITLPAKT